MVTIIFETHSTTFDNEAALASGQYDAELSPLGERQALELGRRREHEHFDAIYCSDQQRSYRTAEIAFPQRHDRIIRDPRLRECNYGTWARKPDAEVKAEKPNRITLPFPGGESYQRTTNRMRAFLTDLLQQHNGERVLIIGHRATQHGLEHLINGVPLERAVTAPWKWQPGWEYQLRSSPSPTSVPLTSPWRTASPSRERQNGK